MRFLGLGLFAEGLTDHRFLRPLLRRLCEEMCSQRGLAPVEVGEVLELHSPTRVREENRDIRILEAARESRGAWHILFLHTDGDGDPAMAKIKRVEPARERIAAEFERVSHETIAVVPIRETEAWALADGDALRSVFGTTVRDSALGVPRSTLQVERIPDPKRALNEAYLAARDLPRRRRAGSALALLEPLGEVVSIEVLRRIPAFRDLESDLEEALLKLRFIGSGRGGAA